MNDYQFRIEQVMKRAFEKPWKLIDKRKNEFAYQIPTGFSYKNLEEHIDELYTTCGAIIELKEYAGVVVVKVKPDEFPDSIDYLQSFLELTKGRNILLGFDRSGKPIIHNFRVPHLMIAGQSGYGKTDLIRWILFQLVTRYTPEQLQINIIDMKGFSFLPFRNIPHVRVVRDLSSAHTILKEGKELMDKRSNIVWNSNDRTIVNKFKWHIIVIDEASQIAPSLMRKPENRKIALECDEYAASISAIGREASVGLFYCTQRPDATVINPLVKANMDATFCFRTKTMMNSLIVLDKEGAESLPHGKAGRGLYATDELIEIQVPYIGDDDRWNELLKPYQKEIEENEQEGTEETTHTTDDERPSNSVNPSSLNILQREWLTTQESVRNNEGIGEDQVSGGKKKGDRKGQSLETNIKWTFPHENTQKTNAPK